MGVGSVVFHATLRYAAQLFDELPLYAMALLAAAILRQRGARTAGVQPFVAGWCCFLAASILGSERSTAVHTTMRGVMSVTFALAFVYIFTAANLAASEVDKARRPPPMWYIICTSMWYIICTCTLDALRFIRDSSHGFTIRSAYPPIHAPNHPPTQARGGTDGASLFRATFGCFVGAILASERDASQRPLGCAEQGLGRVGPVVQPWRRSNSA